MRPVLDERRFNRSVGLGRMHSFQDLRDKVSAEAPNARLRWCHTGMTSSAIPSASQNGKRSSRLT